MKVAHYVIAAALSGIFATDSAIAKSRHHPPASNAAQSTNATADGQKSANGASKNKSSGGASDEKVGGNGNDNKHLGSPVDDTSKKGEAAGENRFEHSGAHPGGDAGNNHSDNTGEGSHQNTAHPGNVITEPVRTDNVTVEHPNRNAKKKNPLSKKTAITPKPVWHPSTQQSTTHKMGDRNAIGVAVNNAETKTLDDKLHPEHSNEISSPSGSKIGPEASHHPLFRPPHTALVTPKIGGINGTSFNHAPTGAIGGLAKNVNGVVSGSNFGPRKHPGFNR
jgi:hypothetical protein